jgi:hypothetical protein
VDRRTFLAGTGAVLLTAPLSAEAQKQGKVYRIGMLETRSTHLNAANLDAFRQALLALGYKEGQNLEIVYRSSDGRDERVAGSQARRPPHRAAHEVRVGHQRQDCQGAGLDYPTLGVGAGG